MVGLCGPACRFVYPDVIKSYFIENVPCSLIIALFKQKRQKEWTESRCGELWSQQFQVPSRLFQKPTSRPPFRQRNRQHGVIMPGLWQQSVYEMLRNPAHFRTFFTGFAVFLLFSLSCNVYTFSRPIFYLTLK